MDIERKKLFVIQFFYIAIVGGLIFLGLKFALPLLAPFLVALAVAALLQTPIRFLSRKLRLNRKVLAVLLTLLFYSTIGLMLSLVGLKLLSTGKNLVSDLPTLYTTHIAPVLLGIGSFVEESFLRMDPELVTALEELLRQFTSSLGQMVSDLSVGTVGLVSTLAGSLPGLLIKTLLAIISSFFITIDYDKLCGFLSRHLQPGSKAILTQMKRYLAGTLLVCLRSYACIMGITFVELAVGFSLLGLDHAIAIAFTISLFDILPVLGTGGIMLPWTALTALQGSYPLALGLLSVYLVVTVVRNILEPKIVGSQIGLHPVVTLISMFVGAQIFGVLGLFGLPIVLSLLRHMQESGDWKPFASPQQEKSATPY